MSSLAGDSTSNDAPHPIERAALDAENGTGAARRLPWRDRAFHNATTALLRMDWASVPAEERSRVRETLALLEASLDEAEAALAAVQ